MAFRVHAKLPHNNATFTFSFTPCPLFPFVYSIFTETEVAAIKRVHLYDIILSTTSIKRGDLQENVFFHMADDPCPQPKQLNASQMEPCRLLSGHDYFQVNGTLSTRTGEVVTMERRGRGRNAAVTLYRRLYHTHFRMYLGRPTPLMINK